MDNLYEVVKTWLDAVGNDKITDPEQILNSKGLKKIIIDSKCVDHEDFICKLFPNFKSDSPVLIASLTLIYAAFSSNSQCVQLREEVMCHLDTNVQLAIQEFLRCFAEVNFKDINYALVAEAGIRMPSILAGIIVSPGNGTPSRMALSPETESPLQRFFQTPKRKEAGKKRRWNCHLCANGERIKQMQMQMEEDETDRNLLIQSQNDLKALIADLEKKLQRELSKNDNLAANSLSIETEISEKNEIIKNLEEKCEENSKMIRVLQEDVNYSQKCLTVSTDRLAVIEKKYLDSVEKLKDTENKHQAAICDLNDILEQKKILEDKFEAQSIAFRELHENVQAMKTMDETIEPDYSMAENLGDQLLMDARREIAELFEKLEKSNFALIEAEKQITILESQRTESEMKFKEEIQKIENDREDLKNSLAKSVSDFEGKCKEIKEFEIKFHGERLECESKIQKLENDISELNKFNELMKEEKIENAKKWRENVEQLENAFKQLQVEKSSEMSKLDEKITQISKQNMILSETIVEKQKEIDNVSAVLKNCTKKLKDSKIELQKQTKTSQCTITNLEKDVCEKSLKIDELVAEKTKMQDNVELLKNENSALDRQLVEKETKLSETILDLNGKITEINSIKQHSEILENELTSSKTQIFKLEKDNFKLNVSIEKAKKKIAELRNEKLNQEQLDAKKVENLENALKKLEDQHNHYSAEKEVEINNQTEVITSLKKIISEKEAETQQLVLQINESAEKIESLKSELQKSDSQLEESKLEIETTKKQLTEKIEQLGNKIKKSEENLEILQNEKTSLSEQLSQKESILGDLTSKLSKAQTEYESLTAKSKNLHESFEVEMASMTVKLSKSQEENKILSVDLDKITNDLSEMMKQNQLKSDEISNVRKIHENLEAALKQLESEKDEEIKSHNEEIAVLAKTISAKQTEIEEISFNLQEAEKKVNNLKTDLENKNTHLEELTLQNQTTEKHLNDEVQHKIMKITQLEEKLKLQENEKSALNEKLVEKEENLEKLNCELASKITDYESLTIKLQNLQSSSQEEIEQIKKETDKLIAQKENEIKSCKTEISILANTVIEKQREIEQHISNHQKAEEKILLLKSEVESSKSQFQDVSLKIESIEKETSAKIEKIETELKKSEEHVKTLENEKSIIEEKITKLDAEKTILENCLQEKEINLKQLSTKIEEKQLECDSLAQKINNTESQLEAAIRNLETEKSENAKILEEKEDIYQEAINKLQDAEKSLETEIATLAEKLLQSKAKHSQIISEFESQILKLQTELSEKTSELSKANQNIQNHLQKIADYKNEERNLLKTIEENQSQIKLLENVEKDLQTQLATIKTEFSETSQELNSKISELEKMIEKLQNDNSTLKTTCDNLNIENDLKQTEIINLKEMHQSAIEQQAVEFNREKMQLVAKLELNQRESASAMRNLEAKNLALDEVKKVAMSQVNELLASHGQLRRELDDLVANKSAENTKLGLEVNEARTKCLDLAGDLKCALNDVDGFKKLVRNLKMEKNNAIEEMKKNQLKQIQQLFANFIGADVSYDGFEQMVDKLKSVLDERKKSQNDMTTLIHKLQNELKNSQTEKNRLQKLIDSAKIKMKFWANPLIAQLMDNLDTEEYSQNLKMISSGLDCELIDDDVEKILENGREYFIKIIHFVDDLKKISAAREKIFKNLEEDYHKMEQRTLSLAEINSRLSTEIMKAKNLTSMELSLNENELTSLKSTVSQLNEKIQELLISRKEIEERYQNALDENHKLEKDLHVLSETLAKNSEKNEQFLQLIHLKERVDKILANVKTNVPEMLTVISTLEQRRDNLVLDIFKQTDFETTSKNLKDILENLELIETKKPVQCEELSDSLEDITQDKTFQIINLHEDTFSMPPNVKVPVKTEPNANKSAWVVSPPSKKKQAKPVVVKKERNVSGESWVIPVGPAPVKPARKTESRQRSDSISSTRSLPSKTIPEVKQERDNNLQAVIDDYERKRLRDREQYEESRSVMRQKYENQLEHMKVEMKHLFNQEITKHKLEQSKMAEELKRKNDELRKQNAAYKEDIDDLRNQLWSLSDKILLQDQVKRKEDDRLDLSRQFERISLQPADSWKSGMGGPESIADGSRGNPRFPSMPVEDEDEIFDNRCLEDLKVGRPSMVQDRQSRLTELKVRNSLCLPHLKSSYPVEMQFMSPAAGKESDLKTTLPFGSESQSLTDSSDPSMTKSLLPNEKPKKKEQTSYKRPGPPTPSKNGRPSLSGGDVKLTPKRPLRDQNQRGTPSRLKSLFTSKTNKRESLGAGASGGGGHDENVAPSTPRGKGLRIFQRKPFGGRDF